MLKSFVLRSLREFRQISPELYGSLFPYTPLNPDRVPLGKVKKTLAEFFGEDVSIIEDAWREYTELYRAKGYAESMGESKTLNREESFAFFAAMKLAKLPIKNILEVGTQAGNSTRKILDMLDQLRINPQVTCYDIYDGVKFFRKDEAELRLEDITPKVKKVLDDFTSPGLIFLDARPYFLLKNVIGEVLRRQDWALIIHDCSPHICNPRMSVSRNEVESIGSTTGTWERHVLAEYAGVANPLSKKLDHFEFPEHSLRILPTAHGLAILYPKSFLAINRQ